MKTIEEEMLVEKTKLNARYPFKITYNQYGALVIKIDMQNPDYNKRKDYCLWIVESFKEQVLNWFRGRKFLQLYSI